MPLPRPFLRLLLLAVLTASPARAQATFLPETRLVPALAADPLAASVGVDKNLGSDRLDARLGTERDVVAWRFPHRRFGVDDVALGASGAALLQLRLRRYGEKSPLSFPFGFDQFVDFPLQQGDYAFAGYAAARRTDRALTVRGRLSIVHVSSHLGDGQYDTTAARWTNGRGPIDYSRNYAQVLLDGEAHGVRVYVAPSVLSYMQPVRGEASLSAFVQAGVEARRRLTGRTARLFEPFAAADVRTFGDLNGTDKRLGVSLVAGVRIGPDDGRATELRLSRYTGPSWRGQDYGRDEDVWMLGVRLPFADARGR